MFSLAELQTLLSQVKTVAVLGAKDVLDQPVDRVGRYLMAAGFNVIPVHPKRRNVWGLETYPALTDIPHPVDLGNVFRAPAFCPDHARECLQLRSLPKIFWMQSGIESLEVQTILANHPISVVQNQCLMVEHQRIKSGGNSVQS
jgi:uncharacterized protein